MMKSFDKVNLIPEKGPDTGNYWCSWDTQYRMNTPEDGKDTLNLRNLLTEEFLFGEQGLLTCYFTSIRRDLYVLLDDGWDVPYHTPGNGEVSAFGSLVLNEEKFPGFTGTPQERLQKLTKKVQELGYRGVGLWICANAVNEIKNQQYSLEQSREYWKEKAIWCRNAGIAYWKVDWGYHCTDVAYRDMMTGVVKQYAPDLKIEHASCRGPMDKNAEDTVALSALLSASDYFRTYDVIKEFTYCTTVKRAWDLLQLSPDPAYGCEGVLNVEDAPYLAAGLGCSMGIMRHPAWGGTGMDVLGFGLKYNEVERAIRWQRIAPPFGVTRTINHASEEELCDWTSSIDGPDAEGWLSDVFDEEDTIRQRAPRMLSRNMEFPRIVSAEEETPYVVCSKHPQNGAVSIAFLARTLGERKHITPMVDMKMSMGAFVKPIGIFGEFRTLTIALDEAVEGKIYLQDLCRDTAVDVTDLVMKDKENLVLDFQQIKDCGYLVNDPGDLSAPGFMISVIA